MNARFWLAAMALAVATPCGVVAQRQAVPGLSAQTWTVDGLERTALIAVPRSAAPTAGNPLVFVFHGHGGTSAQAARSFRIHEAWPAAVVIYPQGVPTVGQITDPEGRRPGWQHVPGGEKDRDLRFFDTMLSWAKERHRIDASRVFAAGHSNGGSMVYVLWAARGDRFAALAPSSSVFRPDVVKQAKPKPAFIVTGRQDALVPFASQQASLERLFRLNQVVDRAGETWPGGGRKYSSKAGADVVTYVHDGGHQLPANAGAMMVRFFQESVRPPNPATRAPH